MVNSIQPVRLAWFGFPNAIHHVAGGYWLHLCAHLPLWGRESGLWFGLAQATTSISWHLVNMLFDSCPCPAAGIILIKVDWAKNFITRLFWPSSRCSSSFFFSFSFVDLQCVCVCVCVWCVCVCVCVCLCVCVCVCVGCVCVCVCAWLCVCVCVCVCVCAEEIKFCAP